MSVRIRVFAEAAIRSIQAESKYWEERKYDFGTAILRQGKDIMREECPEGETGNLKASCQSDLKLTPDGVDIFFWNEAWYFPIVDGERRTKAHLIMAPAGKLLVFEKEGKVIAIKGVKHPGSKRYPISKNTTNRVEEYVRELTNTYIRGAPK